jgi:signal transduction histidine kinase
VIAWTIFPLLVYLMLAFPEGRIRLRRDRLIFGAVTGVVVVFYIGSALLADGYPQPNPWSTCTDDCPPNAFQVVPSEPGWIESVLEPARSLLSTMLLAGVTAVLAVRLRAATLIARVTAAPVLYVSIAAILVLVAFIVARGTAPDSDLARNLGRVWALCLPAIAAAFSLGLVQRRLLISSALSTLSRSLGTSPEPGHIGVALRSSLGAPDVEVLVRDGEHWLDEDGNAVDRAALPGAGRTLHEVRDGPRTVAAILMDDTLSRDDQLADSVVALAESALREARLKAELEASLHDLDDSRMRIAIAADVERRRIERDLHDGAQQRLIALRMRLSLAEDLLQRDPAAAFEAIHGLGDDVDHALEEIRSLAHGIYPALLADRGLADALRSVARRSSLPVDVYATGLRRLPAEIETAVYFTCREALQNAAKHAGGATHARISLQQGPRDLTFEVADDGPGFEPSAAPVGTGLRNMRDRIESVGGSLSVVSAAGLGTTVSGTVPPPRQAAP